METLEIRPAEWKSFFDNFARKHGGWPAVIEILAPEVGDQIQIQALPLGGITAETGEKSSIEILVITEWGEHLTHTIDDPSRVWLKRAERDIDDVLEIESPGAATLVYFRAA